jgi:hypothetical protein
MEQPNPIVKVSPQEVIKNTKLFIRSNAQAFEHREYLITDERGRVVRKGAVNPQINEFSLSMAGIATGVYHFCMGQVKQRFVVVW